MAQDRNTYAKRQRETQKRQKAEEKRARRRKKKEFDARGGSVEQSSGSAPIAADAANEI